MNICSVVVKHRSPKNNDDQIIVRFKNGEPGLIRLSLHDSIQNPSFNLPSASRNVEFRFQNRKQLAVIDDFANIIANHVNDEIPNTDLSKASNNIDWSLDYAQNSDGEVGISLKYKNKLYTFVADNLHVDMQGPSDGEISNISGSSSAFHLLFNSNTNIDHNIEFVYSNVDNPSEFFTEVEPKSVQNLKRGTHRIDITNAPVSSNIAIMANIEMVSPYSTINPLTNIRGHIIT